MSRDEVSIIGLGASGDAAARLALAKGEMVYVSDISTQAQPSVARRAGELESLGARVELGFHDLTRIQASRVVVVSPGIASDASVLHELRARGVRWISEPEFAVRFYAGSLIAVTGTNGKTTTSALTAHLLEASGIPVALGGNIGGGIAPPASELALREPPPEWYVLEVSSFQLADTETFAPDIGVLTNLAPDHLDRYPDAASYYADKKRLYRNARAADRWVLNGDDPEALALPGDAPGERYLFSAEPPGGRDQDAAAGFAAAYLRDGALTLRFPSETEVSLTSREELPLLGAHNVMNALAASLAARLAGAGVEGVRRGLRSFRLLPHRLEKLGEVGGVLWVNDSKATNVAAAAQAVESLGRPVVVLLGGKDKGEDFRPLAEALWGRARAAILYGAARERLHDELSRALLAPRGDSRGRMSADDDGETPPLLVRVDEGFAQAVAAAGSLARPGDAVLLSPACSSYDLFESYEERGRAFTELVRARGAA